MAETIPAVSDAAKRIQNEMTMHAIAKSRGWVAFSLQDGKPLDHIAYPARVLAVKAAKWDRDNYLFLEVQAAGMSEGEAQAVLEFGRQLHDAGFRIPSPEFDFDPVMPYQAADRRKKIAHLASGGRLFPKGY